MRSNFLVALIVLCLLVQTQAFLAAILTGATCTLITSILTGGLGPLFSLGLFASSSYTVHLINENEKKVLNETLINRIKEANNPTWVSCNIDHPYTLITSCIKKKACTYELKIQKSTVCNVCGESSSYSLIYKNPHNPYSYEKLILCKDQTDSITVHPFDHINNQFWDCAKVPNYAECRKCGSNTKYARYIKWTPAGVLLNCYKNSIDAPFEQIEQLYV